MTQVIKMQYIFLYSHFKAQWYSLCGKKYDMILQRLV